MNLYTLTRTDEYWRDEVVSMVVAAPDEIAARTIAMSVGFGDQDSATWWTAELKLIGTAAPGVTGIVFTEYQPC